MGLLDNTLQRESTKVVLMSNCSSSQGKSGRLPMVNDHRDGLPKYKQRSVSAVRDFPLGCGRHVPRIFLEPKDEAVCISVVENPGDIVRNGDAEGDGFITSRSGLDSKPPKALENLAAAIIPENGDMNHVEPKVEAHLIPLEDGIESQPAKALENTGSTVIHRQSDRLGSEVEEPVAPEVENGNQVKIEPLEVSFPGVPDRLSNGGDIEQLKSSEHETVNEPNILEKKDVPTSTVHIFPPKYPPRRKISAIRDFPPSCGRNAAPLIHGNLNAAPQNGYDDLKKMGDTIDNGDNHKSQMETQVSIKDRRNQDKFGAYSKNETEIIRPDFLEQSIKSRQERIQDQRELKTQAGLESGKRSIKVSDDIEGLDIASNRHIVLGLAAAGTGPSVEVKNTHKANQAGLESGKRSIKVSDDIEGLDIASNRHIVLALAAAGTGPSVEVKNPHKANQAALESGKRSIKVSDDIEGLDIASNRHMVLGLAAAGTGPSVEVKNPHKANQLSGCTSESKQKKSLIFQEHSKACLKAKKNDVENYGGVRIKEKKKQNLFSGGQADEFMEGIALDMEENHVHVGESDNLQLVRRSQSFDVTLPPCPIRSSGKNDGNDACVTRSKVKEVLRLYHAVYRKVVKEAETQSKSIKRPDCVAATILKDQGRYVNLYKIIGPVPGVEVGDEFQYRAELHIIGLHRPSQAGIDYEKDRGNLIAISIVASGGYDDNMDDSDVLIYTGSGGNVMNGKKEPEDQKLEKGNLALKNSVDAKNPVRVIRGDMRESESSSAKTRMYVYDGLYEVEKCWQEVGPHKKLIFKFKLVRLPGQPELAWKVIKKSKRFKIREGLCMDDISKGKEIIPICAVNTINEEKPPPFEYITRVIYLNRFQPVPARGCGCTRECSETGNCSCVAKNEGGIAYNHNGAIVEVKPLVYECGPSCKCPPSCYNKVSQHGIKYQLEIFKTEWRGWGVRSLNSISSGSFICEYVGELLDDVEAEERKGNDEYLFDIGNSYTDGSTLDGPSNRASETHQSSNGMLEGIGFTIDAANYGNVGRFINHSCSPNLYAQNVLYDHEDKRVPHIILFAADNIPPLQELTYDYNYKIDEVLDADGNIKKKKCYCGSSECRGRLY